MTGERTTIRTFIAVQITPQARQVLVETQTLLKGLIPNGVRWVDPTGIHLTLKFLGEIDPALVNSISNSMRTAAEGAAPFNLALGELGVFPNSRQPRVLWAGIGGDLESLTHLQARVEQWVGAQGFPRERRAFSPHLTLGRVGNRASNALLSKIGDAVSATQLTAASPWVVYGVCLIRSNLSPEGATYTTLDEAPLGKPGSD